MLSFSHPLYSDDDGYVIQIDTSRFLFTSLNGNFKLIDNLQKTTINLNGDLLINRDDKDEEKTYVSSYHFSERTNAFEIQNGLIGIQLSSFSAMDQGSAQAAEGRDIFLVYDPKKMVVNENVLDFGVTKQRQRYMGCLSAKTSHFILADVDKNGLIDIGRIKEELKCEEFYDPIKDMEGISGPYFIQDTVQWYVFDNNYWIFNPSKININKYDDLPLIEIKLNPIDFSGYIKWRSYDPQAWDRKSEVNFYPRYRLQLMKNN